MPHPSVSVPPPPGEPTVWDLTLDDRSRALEQAVDLAVLAPSVHNTQPWRIEVHHDRLVFRADRSRQLLALDPLGRELVQSVGAAVFNARVALAARGFALDVRRLPEPDDPDLLAVVRLVAGPADDELAALAPAVPRRRTNRREFLGDPLPDELVRRLVDGAAAEGALLVPVQRESQRRLVARLTQQADRLQNADPAYRAELRHWTTRERAQGDGVPAAAVPHVDGLQHDELPLRDFDTSGEGALPAEIHSGLDQTLVLLATHSDDQDSWLRCGEALERILLELTGHGWSASPVTQAIEQPLTRTQLRSALTWDAHPQLLLRIGRAAPAVPTPRRRREEVVTGSLRPPAAEPPAPSTAWVKPPPEPVPEHRPVSDGRGGTTWI